MEMLIKHPSLTPHILLCTVAAQVYELDVTFTHRNWCHNTKATERNHRLNTSTHSMSCYNSPSSSLVILLIQMFTGDALHYWQMHGMVTWRQQWPDADKNEESIKSHHPHYQWHLFPWPQYNKCNTPIMSHRYREQNLVKINNTDSVTPGLKWQTYLNCFCLCW